MNVSLTKAFVKAGNQTKIAAETKTTRQYCQAMVKDRE
ncbi:MAG: hypothetical protein CFH02_01109, partial [Alphaproteobacteria bacterium MarineAlpha3_Bin1]